MLSAGSPDGQGAWLLTPAQLAGLKVTPPADWSGTLDLTISATAVEKATGVVATSVLPVSVTVNPVADVPLADPVGVTTPEDVPVALSLNLRSTDDSAGTAETVAARIAGVPVGAKFTHGDGVAVGTLLSTDTATATWLIDAADVAGLMLVPPENGKGAWTLSITPIAHDGGDQREGATETIRFQVDTVSDAPSLSVSTEQGDEDTRIPLDIRAMRGAPSEVLTVTITGIPAGATLTAAQLANLTIQPKTNSDADFTLSVQAHSRDGAAATADSAPQSLLVTVTICRWAPPAVTLCRAERVRTRWWVDWGATPI